MLRQTPLSSHFLLLDTASFSRLLEIVSLWSEQGTHSRTRERKIGDRECARHGDRALKELRYVTAVVDLA